ncbi:hypothetical protein BJF79_44485 [Actinomadura sp. CNU-125]|uniref:hypothetical protein n=1 Tax=Actinomadura sp. CNU-125 TaxID=1904961 RepID=UPI00095D69E2|nr:hypothetical protein [Actinomadura sp. CNU-125]OLT25149.1 hypothetical protein BJF79_44485 [Actinomadura sp. CNU-125]
MRLLAGYRRSPAQSWLVSYLLPTERAWTDECVASGVGPTDVLDELNLCALGDAAQLDALPARDVRAVLSREVLVTLMDAVGADLLPFLVGVLGDRRVGSRERGLVLDTIAALPSDDAFRALLDRIADRHARTALVAAMKRYPVRALRLLAAAGTAEARELLETHARTNTGTVEAALPALPADVRAAVETLMAAPADDVREAAPDELPAFLADPPWNRPVKPVATVPEPPAALAMAWRDGERAEWLATATGRIEPPPGADWKKLAARYRGGARVREDVPLLVHGPEPVVRPLLPDWTGTWIGEYGWEWMRIVVARYETDALVPALQLTEEAPAAAPLLPFTGSEVALRMGEWLSRAAKHAGPAAAWFDRHGLDAVPYLVPAALGTKAKPRRDAEAALRHLADRHGAEAVAGAAPDVSAELLAVLSAHPVRTGLVRRPKLPAWADPAVLPRARLRAPRRALPYGRRAPSPNCWRSPSRTGRTTSAPRSTRRPSPGSAGHCSSSGGPWAAPPRTAGRSRSSPAPATTRPPAVSSR